jgi:biotin transport system substrate-specific component
MAFWILGQKVVIRVLADRVIRHRSGAGSLAASWPAQLGLAVAGAAFLAASARIALPLPFTPVPITGQTLAVLLIGALYGSRLGLATVLTYMAEGLAGLPVFAQGLSGPAVLFGPTGGYIIGFALTAFVVGRLLERQERAALLLTAAVFLLGDVILFVLGTLWLGQSIGYASAWVGGVLPFLPGEVLKIAIATAVLASGRRLLAKTGGSGSGRKP